MIALLSVLSLALIQNPEPSPPTPRDRVLELEITLDDEPAIEGHGPTAVVEYEVEFDGALHVWATSELDLFLRVDDAAHAVPLASDDDSGGGTTPYLQLDVHKGDWLMVLVAGDPASTGPLTLHLIAAPETEAGRAAEKAANVALREATRLANTGQVRAAREITARAMPDVLSTDGGSHPELVLARASLGMWALGVRDFEGARELWEAVLAARERTLPEDHPHLLSARGNLANSMHGMGDLAGARVHWEAVLAARERGLPEDHPDLLSARENMAISMHDMGDLAGARALREAVLASYERTLPEDHPALLRARENLAASMLSMGDLAGARALWEAVLAGYERRLPEDHLDLLRVRSSLAASMNVMGDLAGARALREAVLEGYERTLPADHPDLLMARESLARSMHWMGDLAGARALEEAVLAAYERTLPADHPHLLTTRANLAVFMADMGDLAGARALEEAVLAAYERTLPADHPELLRLRGNLANSMHAMGDVAGARALWEAVLASYERTLPDDHPERLKTRTNLADSMAGMGDLAGARALREVVLADCERTLPVDHPLLLTARANLAASMHALGDLAGARALWEAVLEGYERTLPADHPARLMVRGNLASSMYASGDRAGAYVQVLELASGMRKRLRAAVALAPRQARRLVSGEDHRLSEVLFLGQSGGEEIERAVFELTETMRLVAAEAARSLASCASDPELAPILGEAAQARRELSDLVAGSAREKEAADDLSARLTALSLKRDRLEREANQLLADRGVVTRPVTSEVLVAALGSGDAAIGYRRIALRNMDESSGTILDPVDHLLAHVLTSEGALKRVDLGPASELEELGRAWRESLGKPWLRGVGLEERGDDAEPRAGNELRVKILDPILAAAGKNVQRLFVCADDLLFLLPLDALPMGEADRDGAERVGDRIRIVNEVSFARLLAPAPPVEAAPSLLALGGVDYDADGASPQGLSGSSAPIEAGEPSVDERGDASAGASASRSALPERFQKLLQARFEAEATAELFEEAFDSEPVLLTRKETTKAALFDSAPGKRYVHLATHGWFAPESVRSSEDPQPLGTGLARMGVEDRVTGFAPMTLCGLALAGANGGRDSLGRVPGILTAEELCSLDLSQCELAVLSACETNVGVRRAGQGIQSLQSALYAAGARTSITSLWRVDDAATRRLMELFYTNLWVEGLGKAEALWQAKRALRGEGHPPAHWAGWVLTGDPN